MSSQERILRGYNAASFSQSLDEPFAPHHQIHRRFVYNQRRSLVVALQLLLPAATARTTYKNDQGTVFSSTTIFFGWLERQTDGMSRWSTTLCNDYLMSGRSQTCYSPEEASQPPSIRSSFYLLAHVFRLDTSFFHPKAELASWTGCYPWCVTAIAIRGVGQPCQAGIDVVLSPTVCFSTMTSLAEDGAKELPASSDLQGRGDGRKTQMR